MGKHWPLATTLFVFGCQTAFIITSASAGTSRASASKAAAAVDPALDWSNYEKITLAGTSLVNQPMSFDILPDGRVLWTTRPGLVRLTDPSTGVTKTVNTFHAYFGNEDGLYTVNLDPNFATNHWVWIFYAPLNMEPGWGIQNPTTLLWQTPTGNSPKTLPAGQDETYWDRWKGYWQLSRIKWDNTASALDIASEQKVIKIPIQRGQGSHNGGDVAWDENGNLFLSTGDNTPAGGFNGSNDIQGNHGADQRRSAGNTNDLRGKILRIHVNSDTDPGYTIPPGNLFPLQADGTPQPLTKPEIYVMGVRNPWRIDYDKSTKTLTWGDYGPDSGVPSETFGPEGKVEWNATKVPMNSGWPYCIADNSTSPTPDPLGRVPFLTGQSSHGHAYNEYNYATNQQGPWYDCQHLANHSRLNTGLTDLPPATAATLYYGDAATDQPWPEFRTFVAPEVPNPFQSPNAGPMYHYDPVNPSQTKWPAYWDGKWFFDEFDNHFIAAFTLNDATGQVTKIENVLPNAEANKLGIHRWHNVIDMAFGPDGSLYTLEYGAGGTSDTGLFRTDWAPGNKTLCGQIKNGPYDAWSGYLRSGKYTKLTGKTWTVTTLPGSVCPLAMKATPDLLKQWARRSLLKLNGWLCGPVAGSGPGQTRGGSCQALPSLTRRFSFTMYGQLTIAQIKQELR